MAFRVLHVVEIDLCVHRSASRLESFDKQRQSSSCRVLIAKETLEYLDNQFEVENWGTLALKGKVERVDVYRVISALQSLTTDGDSEA